MTIRTLRQFNHCENGTFTIESSLVFPVVMLTALVLLFFSLFVYQKVELIYLASQTAERAAFNWESSMKDWETGAFSFPERDWPDGLYWRVMDDDSADIAPFLFLHAPSENSIAGNGCERDSSSASLVSRKLDVAAAHIPPGIRVKIDYRNLFIDRTITVCLERKLSLPYFAKTWFGGDVARARATAKVVEPVEFIRNLDLVQTYVPYLKGALQNGKYGLNALKDAIELFGKSR